MWKPLIRRFRRYLKHEALPRPTYETLRSKPMARQGAIICKAVGMPRELAEEPKAPLAMLMLVSSHCIIRRKQLGPEAKRVMGEHAAAIWRDYYEIFNENS